MFLWALAVISKGAINIQKGKTIRTVLPLSYKEAWKRDAFFDQSLGQSLAFTLCSSFVREDCTIKMKHTSLLEVRLCKRAVYQLFK